LSKKSFIKDSICNMKNFHWIILAILSAFFAALVTIFGKIGVKDIDSTLATTIRVLIMTIFLVGVSFFFQKWPLISTISSRPLLFIILSGLAGALSWLFYFLALKFGPAGVVAALDRLSVVFVIFLAALFLGEGLNFKTVLGIILLISGTILLVFQ